MTPAINLLNKQKVPHQVLSYAHDPNHTAFGLEAVEKLNLAAHQVFKTLVAQLNTGELLVSIVPVEGKLNLKALAQAAGAKKANMAEAGLVERTTGYLLGGVSPLAQKKSLKTFIDVSAEALDTLYVSGGRRGLEIQLSPQDLAKLTRARFVALG